MLFRVSGRRIRGESASVGLNRTASMSLTPDSFGAYVAAPRPRCDHWHRQTTNEALSRCCLASSKRRIRAKKHGESDSMP